MPKRQDTTWMCCISEEKERGLCLITPTRAYHVTSVSPSTSLLKNIHAEDRDKEKHTINRSSAGAAEAQCPHRLAPDHLFPLPHPSTHT